MQIFKNNHYLKAAFREKVHQTPIWIMRQSDLSSQAALLPINHFSLDAAIMFSDILILPYAMGMDIKFLNDFGPKFLNPIKSRYDIEKLLIPNPEEHINYVLKMIQIVSYEINNKIPLIGFAGSPWTLACYMLEENTYKIPVTIFTKNSNQWLKDIANSGCDVIALDWSIDIQKARKQVGSHVALQGNMDPHVLYAKKNYIKKEIELILSKFGFGEGHIFSLGHGILPDTDPKKIKFLVDSVHHLSQKYHQK
ncbi:hypothetical protein GQX74_015803 [Glossina fuscipes]|nr:hypothetical protein GQX74_015803 [Glossina fuscipes]